MAQHIQILGILHIINGAFTLLAGGCAIVFMSFGTFAYAIDGNQGGALAVLLLVLVFGGLIVLSALPGIIGGIGILGYQRWARIVLLIVGAISLFSFPLGTALGIYTFWVLLNDETQRLFS